MWGWDFWNSTIACRTIASKRALCRAFLGVPSPLSLLRSVDCNSRSFSGNSLSLISGQYILPTFPISTLRGPSNIPYTHIIMVPLESLDMSKWGLKAFMRVRRSCERETNYNLTTKLVNLCPSSHPIPQTKIVVFHLRRAVSVMIQTFLLVMGLL